MGLFKHKVVLTLYSVKYQKIVKANAQTCHNLDNSPVWEKIHVSTIYYSNIKV